MPKENQDKIMLSKNLFPVVGIGASAGGLEAFKKFVQAIPVNSGMAYILVQHLHPEHTSSLSEILQREATIVVEEITNNVEVKPDHIYIMPPNKILTAMDGVLQLNPRPSKDDKNMAVDIFFKSLAEVHKSHAIGIVLSGTGTDGTLGLKCIKEQGGITFAQELDTAAYDGMPQNAISADVIDFVLAPEKMPQQLLAVYRTFSILPSNEKPVPEEVSEEENFRRILALVHVRKSIDFTYYKQTTIRRRILRRIAICKMERIADYLEYLQQNRQEQDILLQDLLIPVTEFFRDPKTFDSLSSTIFPEIIKSKSAVNALRIWIAGCSTGEEAYSMSICLHEFLSDKASPIKIQVFATDISEKSIAKARAGLYNKRELQGVSEARLNEFFTKIDGSYQVNKNIRNMCVFALHNFLKDPPFAKIDIISCRNVLIYMEPLLQRKAFSNFHYALNEKGFLLLGKSETTGSASEFFLSFGKKEKLYTKKILPARFMTVASDRLENTIKDTEYGVHSHERKRDGFQKNADDILLSRHTPAGVIVNEQFDIVQFRGATGDFLEALPGKASLNILKMAREGLSFELRNALQKAKSSREVFVKESIAINKGKRKVTIYVIPLLNTAELHFLILFKDTDYTSAYIDQAIGEGNNINEKEDRIKQLEKELLQAREDMRCVTEDQEAVNEELQSVNEELLSGTEELQSLNEEMETSKEELQSTNEELITVNQELFDRNDQFNQARQYAETIVTTVHEPLLVLNPMLQIKSANKSFYKTFSLTEEQTIGKIIFDLQNNQWNIPDLRNQLLKIKTGDEKFLEWESTYTFPVTGQRTICFNAQPLPKENSENWILVAFNDITVQKEMEKVEKKYLEGLKTILENIPAITFTASPDGAVTYFNNFFLNYSGMTFSEALEHEWVPVIKPEMLSEVKKSWEHSTSTGDDFNMEIELKRKSDNMDRWHVFRASAIRNEDGNITSWIGAATDIHEQKTKEKSKDEFISIASHELKTPLTTAKAYIQLMVMSMKGTNHEYLTYAQKVNTSINRLNKLIEELLDVTKIQNGKLALNITTFDFTEMLAEAIEEVQPSSPLHHIMTFGKVEKAATGDRQRLQQVIINLLTNAVKYSPKADKVLVQVMQNKDEITVSVNDKGIGIRKENIDKIFERYYREEGTAIHFQGLGIGLSISQEIVQRHNGKIWAESDDKGSTFYFTIPT